MELEKSLDLWLKYRTATEQRNYWFLLAQTTVLGIVASSLDKLFSETVPIVLTVSSLAALAFASAMVTVASIVAYRWDWERLASVQTLIESAHRSSFTADWDKAALLSPFGFALFHFALATAVSVMRHDCMSLAIVVVAAALTVVSAFCLTKETRSFLRRRASAAANVEL